MKAPLQKVPLRRVTLGMTLVMYCGLYSVVANAQDRVYNLKNVPVSGTVTEITPDKITLETANSGPRSFAVNEIARVSFGEEPKEFAKIHTALREGNYESALNDLQTIDANSLTRDYVKQELLYYRAFCAGKIALATGGKREEALAALQGFLRANSTSHHFYEGAELLGDLASATGDFANSARFYAAIAKAPWPDYQLRAAVLEAKSLLAQKNFAEAQRKYETVLANADSSAEANRQKLFAMVGKARCLASLGNVDEATKILEDLIKNNDSKDSRLFGRAYNALGSCYLAANRPKEALIQFLHVHLMFYNEADAHAEALHHLVILWNNLQKSDRAVEARSLLIEQYGGSIWAKGI